ncbi:putative deferrochelatase/peroxidase EfeN [Pseudoclavibacter triregionum]|nr:putative deferrochelatase/peroxidase EfeN [Pseudoclavibacter triregionum]
MSDRPASDEPAAAAESDADGVSRRGLLGSLLAVGGGLALGAGVGAAADRTLLGPAAASAVAGSYPYFGEHQQGITTPAQDRLHFAAFTIREGKTRDDVAKLLREWSYAASRLTQGLDVSASGAVGGPAVAPPDDTGEALGLPPSGLTITFGFGPGLFVDESGADRFGLAAQKPAGLEPLPRFAGDDLREAVSGGDLCIQACAENPQIAVHAIRNLTRIAFGTALLKWSQLGFGRTSSTSTSQATPRNLFGFKDGTANIKAEEREAVRDYVWVGDEGPEWLRGGTFLVARRIRMLIESWDRVGLGEQERIFGRDKREGAPLGKSGEFDSPDFAAGTIDARAHVALAHPANNAGKRILRRGYNFVDGNDELGRLNAGLFFISMQRDPAQFIDVQRSLATDLLNEYIRHEGSGIWAVPPGAPTDRSYVGETLFGA